MFISEKFYNIKQFFEDNTEKGSDNYSDDKESEYNNSLIYAQLKNKRKQL